MKCRGQIISLDAVIALILVMLSLGIVFNVMETNAYDLKETQLFEEISSMGKTAGNLLVSNENIICKVKDGGKELFSMNNCLDLSKFVRKEYLGIDSQKYSCKLTAEKNQTQKKLKTACTDNPVSAQNIYSETREIIVNEGDLTKQKFEELKFKSEKITLKVWKK